MNYAISENLFTCLILLSPLLWNYSSQLQFTNQKLPLETYETLAYDDFTFEAVNSNAGTSRSKRQVINGIDSPILESNRLRFKAFGRNFEIYLKRDIDLMADKVDIEVRHDSSKKPTQHINDFFTSNYYTGFVEGESRSHVVCYFERNQTSSLSSDKHTPFIPLVYAQIQILNEFHNENENTIYYIEPLIDTNNHENKYLIYRTNDINSDVLSNNILNKTVCRPKYFNNRATTLANSTHFDEISNSNTNRAKRQLTKNKQRKDSKPKKNRCYLALVADHRFFKEIGNSNVKLTTAYLINIIGAINVIFTRTKWNLNEEFDEHENFGFSVEKVIVHSEPTNAVNHYNHPNSSLDADRILELFGEEDWSSYCLAHLFTFQSFENSVLGLAYVSSPLQFSLGGICSKTTSSRRQQSVNTGLSSYKSVSQRQVRLLQREAELVTAHEFGHNWGSEHDPLKPECTPSSSNGGNFIMYAYSNQGHEKNNYYFSPCTINSISEVIKAKSTCFKGESLSYCGNDRIEGLEECDAGLSGRQGLDKCCDYDCKLKKGAECSDSNHYCCNECKIAPKGRRCYSSSNYIECFEDHSFCTGKSRDCPSQSPKPGNTSCNSHDFGRCNENGQCLSICQQIDPMLRSCHCADQEKKCMICCRNSLSNECKPLQELFPKAYKDAIYLSNGRPCFDGLCENRECRQRVKDYVGRLWKVIQTVTVSGLVEFMKRNIVGSIIIISLVFWVPFSCCIHFCFDKRNRQIQKQRINEIRAHIQSSQERSSKRSYTRLPTSENEESIVKNQIVSIPYNKSYMRDSSL